MSEVQLAKLLEDEELTEAHDHLAGECPWYHAGCDGQDVTKGDPDSWHKPSGALVKFSAEVQLTPRTAEASTVPQPTVPPGGPGLFHVKGMQLPPYIQHLYKHLVGRYGKEGAYRVAVGVVKKWAAGVNPGGWQTKSGKGKRTHPDVQAAAQKNVAEWEKDKARAHAQTASHGRDKVKATVALGPTTFPGQDRLELPPVPDIATAKAMYTAHRTDDTLRHLAHAIERLVVAKKTKALRAYYMTHANNHLSKALDTGHNLAEALRRNYPAEGRELDLLNKTMLTAALTPETKAATFAHLLQTILYDLAHAKRHALLTLDADPESVWLFNWDHCAKHTKGAIEHTYKLAKHIYDNYPDEAKWLRELDKAEDPNDPFTGLEAVSVGLASGNWATVPGGGPAPQPPTPGAGYGQYGLHQKPSSALAPSPPLPPEVAVPTAREVRALIPLVPQCTQAYLSSTVRTFLETSAVKLEKNDELEALHMLRSVQAALRSAHKADLAALLPQLNIANVFTRVVPDGQNAAAMAGRERALAWRKLEAAVDAFVSRLRKRFFRGMVNGPLQSARLSGSPLDRLVQSRTLTVRTTPGQRASIL